MKITNIRVLNNYKIKLINATLAGVNTTENIVAEQGTRSPVLPTPANPVRTFQEKFNVVMKYLISRYEPGWSAADPVVGKAATMALLGVSSGINPLTLGGTVENAFNVLSSTDAGWFDPLTHPKDFATAVKAAYRTFERARKPAKAKHRFVDYSVNGIGEYSYSRSGGNMFFNMRSDSLWYPESVGSSSLGLSFGYANGIERHMLHSPYGIFRSPMYESGAYYHKQSLPWMSDRYAPDAGWVFDQYLKIKESATLRDMLTDCSVERNPLLGVLVDGVTDTYLNTFYRGMCYPDGVYSKTVGNRANGGYSAGQVLVGSPWIPYPNGVTWTGALSGFEPAGLCFDIRTLTLFDGTTFLFNPPTITDRPVDFATGLSWGNGETRIHHLNLLADAWGNSMEFIFYTGLLPYGAYYEQAIPWMLYKDPTDPEHVRYTKWRLDASMAHWKEKFKSPIDGFAHIMTDSAVAIERTYHRYMQPSYMTWGNVLPSGASYVENIPVSWFRDQYNYTYGLSGPSADKGVVTGVELFGWYDWSAYPAETWHKKSPSDSAPKHWIFDEDIASAQYSSIYDLVVGQRVNGFTLTNRIWGMGICGTSVLGEIYTTTRIADQRTPDGYPFYYNTFIGVTGNALEWKRVANTRYENTNLGVPWYHDRRFTLFYHYPIVLALGGTILDHIHNGFGYYYANQSRWFDVRLGSLYAGDMEALNLGTVVSNIPFPNRRTPTTPPQNHWTGNARESEFELLYACMKGGITAGLDSLYFTELYNELEAVGATGF